MTLLEEIQKNSGELYLSEGIMFFKDSKKMRRLENMINKKLATAKKKGDISNLSSLDTLMKKIQEITFAFERLETKYKESKDKGEKQKLKAQYNSIKKKYEDLLRIVNKETVKKVIIAVGLTALIVSILFVGFHVLVGFEQSGVLTAAAENVGNRIGSANSTNVIDKAVRGVKISQTNSSLQAVLTTLGITLGAPIGLAKLSQLQKKYRKDKMTTSTFRVLNKLESAEAAKDKSKVKKETKAMTDGDEE